MNKRALILVILLRLFLFQLVLITPLPQHTVREQKLRLRQLQRRKTGIQKKRKK